MIYDSTVPSLVGFIANLDCLQFAAAPGEEATCRIKAVKKLRGLSAAANCDAATIRFERMNVVGFD